MGAFKNLLIEKSKKKKVSESDILAEVLDGLDLLYPKAFDRINNIPVFNRRTNNYQRPNKYQRKGISDIIGCIRGKFIAIEVKTPTEYTYVINFLKRIDFNKDYVPANKKEAHIMDQFLYIMNKRNLGGIAFFTYSLEDTLNKLGGAFENIK